MSLPGSIAAYPPEFFDLLRRACQQPIELTFDNDTDAERLRFRLYGFRTALTKHTNTVQDQDQTELAIMATGLEMLLRQLDDGRTLLILRMREEDPAMDVIREALAK